MNSFRRTTKSYRRGTAKTRPTGHSFLIVTEGKKTEPNYFHSLIERLRLSPTNVEIVHPEGTDPLTIVKEAINLRDAKKREAKNGLGIEYDEVWVVFDLEKTHDERRQLAKDARNIKGARGIRFAESDPCFEYWLLLFKEYTTRPFSDCREAERRLREYLPNYTKGKPLTEDFLDDTPSAVHRARRCREHHKSGGGDGNPSTKVDLLVENLNSATRPHFRFQF